jgi:hypothetical protein
VIEAVALALSWSLTSLVRFALLRGWVFARRAPTETTS